MGESTVDLPSAQMAIVVLSLPLILLVVGVLGIARRPPLAFVMTLSKASLVGRLIGIRHTVSTPVRLKSFLAELNDGQDTNILYSPDCEYRFNFPPGELVCEAQLDAPWRVLGTFDAAAGSLKISQWSSQQGLLKLPAQGGNDEAEFAVPRPLIVYKRIPSDGTVEVVRAGKETQYVETKGAKRFEMFAAARRSPMGDETYLLEAPSVTSQLLAGASDEEMLVTLSMHLVELTIENASGSIALGSSRWTIADNDTVKIKFLLPRGPRTRSIGFSGGGSITFTSKPNLVLSRRNASHLLEVTGPAKSIHFNEERMRDTVLNKTLYWSLAAIAGGVVTGALGLYFAYLKKLFGI